MGIEREVETKKSHTLGFTTVISSIVIVLLYTFLSGDYTKEDDSIWLGLVLLVLWIVLPIYFIPFFIAGKKKHPNAWLIYFLNFFLGFTVVGWIAMLVWMISYENIEDQIKTVAEDIGEIVKASGKENTVASELKELVQLKESGTINEEEFAVMKKKIMTKYGH